MARIHPSNPPSAPGASRAARVAVLLVALLGPALAAGSASARTPDFTSWLGELRREAIARGISPATVEAALAEVRPVERALELDRSQPRRPADFCGYLARRLTSTRIERAQEALREHGPLLRKLQSEYGVPPRYLVSIWGLETNFGDYMGDFPVVPTLATLAHDPRRSGLFREQVFAALRILDEGHQEPGRFLGSWAGASGHVQFMPTTFLDYAVDHDGDGRKNVWSSVPDALASAANYLRSTGWRSGQSWGRRVALPEGWSGEGGDARLLGEWQRRGVRRHGGGDLPAEDMHATLVQPSDGSEPAFLVYANYRSFLAWNRSTFFALSLGGLADRVSERGTSRVCGL